MSDTNNYLRNELLDHVTNLGIWTPPSALILALLKSASSPTDDPVTNAAKEILTPGVDGYTRQTVPFATVAAGGVISNTTAVTFGPATAGWPTIVDVWVLDTATVSSGNILFQKALSASKTVDSSGSLVFAVGEIKLKLA